MRPHSTPLRVQRAAAGGRSFEHEDINVDRGLATPGAPLQSSIRRDMEHHFGADFSSVRIHADAAAAQSAAELGANAYTVGRDIVFGAGRHAPESPEGRRLLAHELTHVLQQSNPGGSSMLQKEESTAHPGRREITLEEYKKLTPSMQALTWGPDFVKGFKRSGASTQIGNTAAAIIETGFTSTAEYPILFRTGAMLGVPWGTGKAVFEAGKSLFLLAIDAIKLYGNWLVSPQTVIGELASLLESVGKTILMTAGAAEAIGLRAGQMLGKEAAKTGINFVSSGPFAQGFAIGEVIGRVIGEVALMFVGVGEVRAAVKAVAATRAGRVIVEAIEASKLLRPLLKNAELAKSAEGATGLSRTGSALLEGEVGGAKAAALERDAVQAGRQALPPSTLKDVISPAEALEEVRYVNEHPEVLAKDMPPRAVLRDHEIVQLPDGTCARHSKEMPVPCPDFKRLNEQMRGKDISDLFKEAEGKAGVRDRALGEPEMKEVDKPGKGAQPRQFARGNFAHHFAEHILGPARLPLPNEAEVVVLLSDGTGDIIRVDRVVRDTQKGLLLEIKPAGRSADRGRAQLPGRIDALNKRFPKPQGWTGEVVEYTPADVRAWLVREQVPAQDIPRLMRELGF